MTPISVILTTFNSEKTLQRALDSVLKQEGKDSLFSIELLVVDDCSTDHTQAILKTNNIPFKQTEKNSGGPNKGRNMALKIASGDFICFIDHDDEWLPNKLLKQLEASSKAPIITCGYITHNNTNAQIIHHFHRHCKEGYLCFQKNETFQKKLSKDKNAQRTYFGSVMVRKELKDIFFEEVHGMVDFDWILRIFENRDSIEICSPLFIRYVDGPNLSLNENYRQHDFDYSLSFIENYRLAYPLLVEKGRKKIHGSMARYYYLINNMPKARKLFLQADLSLKNILYYTTSFVGSSLVRKYFNIFG
jgi:glycosyltransferase involved in cell wall biosynthesis